MGIEYCRAIAPATAGRLSAVRAACPRSIVHVLGPWDRTRPVIPIIVSNIRWCVKHPLYRISNSRYVMTTSVSASHSLTVTEFGHCAIQ
jgi:hypothetical protein